MEFIESSIFQKYVYTYMDDDEYSALQWHLAQHPLAGDLIPRSGGLRKVRWRMQGSGKRGGARVIYYYRSKNNQIWLLTIYAKNEMENISTKVLELLRKEVPK